MDECLPATYRTGDAIDNLLIKVAIRRRHASPDTAVGASAYSPPSPAEGVHDEGSELRVFEFAWQQKIYGPRELLKYSQAIYARKAGQAPPGAPLSPLEADYMADLERRLDSGEPLFEAPGGVLLYTMTDRDGYVLPSEARRAFMGGGTGAGAVLPAALTGAFAEQWRRLLGGPGAEAGAAAPAAPLASPPAASHLTPADIAAGVEQHADPRSVFAHAYKEHPYSVMYIMAAVGVDREALRARRPDTAFTEVPLVQVRAYGRRGGAIVLDMKPGFSDVVPYDRTSLLALTRTVAGDAPKSAMAAATALVASGATVGSGRYGGAMRLRMVTPPALASSSSAAGSSTPGFTASRAAPSTPARAAAAVEYDSSGGLLAYAEECHSIFGPARADGCGEEWEYSVINPDEDIAAILAAPGSAPAGSGGRWGLSSRRLRSESGDEGEGDGLGNEGAAVSAEEVRAIERAFNRVPTDFHSALPRGMHLGSFRLSLYVDIVAAAKFAVHSGLLGSGSASLAGAVLPFLGIGGGQAGVYVAYEVVLPRGSGWQMLPVSDVPGSLPGKAPGGEEAGGADEWDVTAAAAADGEEEVEWEEEGPWPAEEEGGPEGGDGAGSGEGLRQRHGGGAGAQLAAASAEPTRPAIARRRWLQSTRVTGITQVAGTVVRPWTFGQAGGSRQAGQAPAEGEEGREGPFSGSCGPGSAVGSGGALGPQGHPFGFSDSGTAAPGFARIDGGHTTRHTGRGGPRVGAGSVSMVSALSSGAESGCEAGGEAGGSWESLVAPPTAHVPVAHIGQPFAVHLECDGGRVGSPAGPSPPQLYLTVVSRDGWDRHRVEGYAWVDLPTTPGSRDLLVPTWRPVPADRATAEAEFYLGGAVRLSDVTYARVPSTWHAGGRATRGAVRAPPAAGSVQGLVQGAHTASLNKLGFPTASSGEVGLRVHAISQRAPPSARPDVAAQVAAAGRPAAAGGSGGSATPSGLLGKTVVQIIADARAIRRKDREFRLPAASPPGGESKAGESVSPGAGLVTSPDSAERATSRGHSRRLVSPEGGPGAISSPTETSP